MTIDDAVKAGMQKIGGKHGCQNPAAGEAAPVK